jgi:two-component system, NarL family, capsular synthesis sensor histidine kinase RcsC
LETALQEGNASALAAELHSLTGALNVFGHQALALQCASAGQSLKADGNVEAQLRLLRQVQASIRAIHTAPDSAG